MTSHSRQSSTDSTTNRSGRFLTLGHLVISAVGWGGIGVLWSRVYATAELKGGMVGVIMVGVFLLVAMMLTVGWIRHNVTLSKKFGDRRSKVYDVEADWSVDKHGRSVAGPDWGTLQAAARLEIEIDDRAGRKIYREV
jgi:hypothetical protein